ncbi:MAG: hypothetical protein JKX76_01910 [Colwellia sp.]|nr:hypothetical protein [Colwellia sp.]
MLSDQEFFKFNRIVSFISAITEFYGTTNRNLFKYNHILQKTQISMHKPMMKQIAIFTEFCIQNSEQIEAKNSDFSEPEIMYSRKVIINMKEIIEASDVEHRQILWRHILYISAVFNPEGNAREILQRNKDAAQEEKAGRSNLRMEGDTPEADFINRIVDSTANATDPQSMMKNVMNPSFIGGLFSDVISGNIDPQKLVGLSMNLVGKLQESMPESRKAEMGEVLDNPMLKGIIDKMGGVSQGDQSSVDSGSGVEETKGEPIESVAIEEIVD